MLQISRVLVLASVSAFLCALLILSTNVAAQMSNELKDCDAEAGICLPIHMCPRGVYNADRRAENVSIRIQLDQPNECDDPLKICCHNLPDRQEEAPPRIRTAAPAEDVLSEAEYGTCGIRNHGGLVYGSVESNLTYARYGEFPWMVAIFRAEGDRWDVNYTLLYAGGGALIHPRFVLTTAEVLRKSGTLYARFGEWRLESGSEKYQTQEIEIVERMRRDGPRAGFDVGLGRLEEPVLYRRHIRPICLPGWRDNFNGLRCIATGWGKDLRTNESPKLLKAVELPVVPRYECSRMLRHTGGMGPHFMLHRTFMCAGGEEEGVDMGEQDGGSPLVCRRRSRNDDNDDDDYDDSDSDDNDAEDGSYVIAGIVSWGAGKFGRRGVPGVYTDVARVSSWIEANIADRDW